MTTLDELNESIDSVFNELLSHSVLNVNIIYQHIENSNLLQAVTWFPYQNQNCANRIINTQTIDECETFENGSIDWTQSNMQFYPKIPNTFHHCPLKITAMMNEPYVLAENRTIEKGLEILMLKTITDKLMMTPIYQVADRKMSISEITSDNETGLYANLLQR